MIKIGQYMFNLDNITWIIEREVHFNNGKSLILSEPEIQTLLAALFDEPREESKIIKAVKETKTDMAFPEAVDKKLVKKAKK